MKVGELIAELETYNPEMEVEFAYGSGDYWGSTIARPVESLREGCVCYSEYHRADKVVDDDCDEGEKTVLLIE